MDKRIENDVIESILQIFDIHASVLEQDIYIHTIHDDGWMKLIFRVTLDDGRMIVVKILHEDDDLAQECQKYQCQSLFSEFMRCSGISTPRRYASDGRFCVEYTYHTLPCLVAAEDWCGDEITEITTDIAYQTGALMAQMHTISLSSGHLTGCRTLFCAAYRNDVDAFDSFCEIAQDSHLDQQVVGQIRALHDRKLADIRAVWDTLPRSAVQGDISINNLSANGNRLTVFDYNNAGDEVLVSDLVLEGLLTAYEMDLPEGVPEASREQLFSAFLRGYLSVRTLSADECAAAWQIYTLYHGLWFTRIVYGENSLDQLVKRGDYDTANRLLVRILSDMLELNDGRFSL